MEVSTPEARHQLPVSLEDSDETDLLHLGPGRGRRVVYSIGWGKRARHITGNPNQRGTCQTPTKMISPSLGRTYDGSGDPEDHLKLFQSAAKTERWAEEY
ncbi:hypothetical protein Tco_0337986 [Tanacetum coccineum]